MAHVSSKPGPPAGCYRCRVTALRWIGAIIGVLASLLVLVMVVARYSDGPIGPFTGGALVGGELLAEADVDWSFAAALSTLELQLVEPERSRTVWFAVDRGALYVPCGYPDSFLKQWPHDAREDGRSIVRIDGRRYERQAVYVSDREEFDRVIRLVTEKYGVGDADEASAEDVWIFRMDPRPG